MTAHPTELDVSAAAALVVLETGLAAAAGSQVDDYSRGRAAGALAVWALLTQSGNATALPLAHLVADSPDPLVAYTTPF